jgi:hypothetical protein
MQFPSPRAVYLDEEISGSGLAPRPASLDGKIVGLLPNWRPAAVNILKSLGEFLEQRYRLKAVVMEEPLREPPSKTGMSLEMIYQQLDELASRVDVVIAENILSIPLNLDASRVVAAALRGRPAILHHHDPPWQVAAHRHVAALPVDDPAWRHVVINHRTKKEMADRGFTATVIYNAFDVGAPMGERDATRAFLDVADDEPLLLHPVRAIPRKNIPGALALAEAVDLMEGSELVAETLGEHVFEWFLRNKRDEFLAYKSSISQFELDRYLPRL